MLNNQAGAAVILGAVLLGGCATGEATLKVSPRDVSGAYCAPLFSVPTMAPRLPALPGPPGTTETPSALVGLSAESRQIAEIIGVTAVVGEMQALEDSTGPLSDERTRRLIEARQNLSAQLVTTFFEVSSVAGRVECEATRANHVAAALSEIQERRTRRYEITAIVGDALIGIVGGGFTLAAKETAAGIADVVGGSFATGFGLAAGLTRGEQEFLHPKKTNVLRELWETPQVPTMFPLSVWRFLNWPLEGDREYRTRREELIAEWRNDGLIAAAGPDDRRASLFFGPGGTYEIDDLRARAQMLEVMKTSLSVMMQYLYVFSQEVLNQSQLAAR